jgi:hypothetical protein
MTERRGAQRLNEVRARRSFSASVMSDFVEGDRAAFGIAAIV